MPDEPTMFRFRLLAAAAPEEVSDDVVEKALMDVIIASEDDIRKICGILERARPELYKKLADRIASAKNHHLM